MIYLYAITEPDPAVPACRGLEDTEVLLARASEVTGLYSEHERIDPRPDPEALWGHDQVVEAAMEAGPTLPTRFGTIFTDEQTLVASLEEEGHRLRRQLERIRGCVELAVRVGLVDANPDDPPPSDGRGYLEAKLSERRRQHEIVRDTLGPLSEIAVRAHHDSSRSEDQVICASYLVRSDHVDRFSDEVTVLADRNPELWLSCTGPWPPYSFARSEDDA